jgi:peptidylprolyl isomerase
MAIKKGDIIKVDYTGRFIDGTIFESTLDEGGCPLKFEVGSGLLLNAFDKAVLGKDVGDVISLDLDPKEAYGDIDPILVQTISREKFPDDLDVDVGMMLSVEDSNGAHSIAWVKDVDDEFVTIDMNHPLAGKQISFEIKILETGCEPDPEDIHECGCGCEHH